MNKIETIKVPMKVNDRLVLKEITLDYEGSRITVHAPYNKNFIADIKAMQGAKWHGFDETNPRKVWSISNTPRNLFQIRYWQYLALSKDQRAANPKLNPYWRYDAPYMNVMFLRNMYDHQKEMVQFALTRHYCIFAAEQGTGKSLAFIEVAERSLQAFRAAKGDYDSRDQDLIWYIGPVAGVRAVGRELNKWESKFEPRMLTYDKLVNVMEKWREGDPAPYFVCFDESSKIKTPTAKRSQAANALANAIREEYGELGYVIEMSGTPAPKSPIDWFWQTEVACPGFMKEGDIHKFKARLCIIEQRESIAGGTYPHIVTWLDDTRKCATCGQTEDKHTSSPFADADEHRFQESVNEVDNLYKRLRGLVLVKFKKDCLDLPEKRFEVVKVKPTVAMINAMKLIKATSPRAIQALTLLRELSDGFQYSETESGEDQCQACGGKGTIDYENQTFTCDNCGGTGNVKRYTRTVENLTTPKDEYYISELDEQEDNGRYVVWGGFTGTIDRLVEISHQQGWATLRIDGRGYVGSDVNGNVIDSNKLLDAMDRSSRDYKNLLEEIPRLVTIGHPQAGGMALTLTASNTALFYSNCFNGEARFQAIDRCHRIGMDMERGYTIKDLICLPTDLLVLENLNKKKRLQDISMGELVAVIERELLDGNGQH